ncbi:replication protein [Streptococcus pneumoniae]|uniref:protein rep n=1 Tax=Streptococcus pneumoniae TaxID=1313 RepID=UPI0007696DFB|nr:protein rep [Streptococcus pneumoniae]CYH45314.1 replication protein [Streptococcus pneumoniae]
MEKWENQDKILLDKNKRGKDRNWRGRKLLSLKLADIFKEFIRREDGSLRLYQAYFCKNKLCPMCNWRRSMKYSYQTILVRLN